MNEHNTCINCQKDLIQVNGLWLCPDCNSADIKSYQDILEQSASDDQIFIECPGATLYDPNTNSVIAGVKFIDDNDPFKGYKIIGHPVYAPTHTKLRKISKEALGHIRRCQGCQDYTIRMRRKEGPDFFIPSNKFPNRTKLKSVIHRTIE